MGSLNSKDGSVAAVGEAGAGGGGRSKKSQGPHPAESRAGIVLCGNRKPLESYKQESTVSGSRLTTITLSDLWRRDCRVGGRGKVEKQCCEGCGSVSANRVDLGQSLPFFGSQLPS